MILAPQGASGPIVEEEWQLASEAVRPEDGVLVRHWARSRYDLVAQLEHTEDRYELWRGDTLPSSEYHARSPATRWYTQAQARALYAAAGFTEIRLLSKFSQQPATAEDTLFTIVGTRPGPAR
jgi:hypothetical protein